MNQYTPTKITEVLRGSEWVKCHKGLQDLQVGDIFRLFELDGAPILVNGETDLYVMDGPILLECGRYEVGSCSLKEWKEYEQSL